MRSGSGRLFRHPGSWDRNRSRMTVHQKLAHWSPTAHESTSANFHLVVVQLTKYQRLAVTQTSSRHGVHSDRAGYLPDQSHLLLQSGNFEVEGAIFGSYPYRRFCAPYRRRLGHGGMGIHPQRQICLWQRRDLFVANHDGSNPRKIATAPGQIGDIKFRRTVLGFDSQFTIWETHFFIWERNRKMADYSPVAGLELRSSRMLRNWTPDGRYYFFQSVRDGVSNIWIVQSKPVVPQGVGQPYN